MFRTLFTDTLDALQPDAAFTGRLWQELEEAYGGPQRHYHTLAHLDALAAVLQPVWNGIEDKKVLVLAVAYHDAVYDPQKGDNEERSADLADERVGALLPALRSERLRNHILATKAHHPSSDPDTDLFTDADLSILGADADTYQRYAAQVRVEYRIYPDAVYRPGRAAVLEKFLAMERIFKTKHFHGHFEKAARKNLQRELAELK